MFLLLFLVRRSLCSNFTAHCICIILTCAFFIVVFFRKTDLKEIGGGGSVDWINMTQNMDWWWALVNTVMNLQFHKGREFPDCLSDYQLVKKCSAPCS
jgi:hypothetical protein